MGQYWIPVNLDKKECISPHKLGAGLKLWEQLANHPGVGAALIVLTAAMPEARGGGDLDISYRSPLAEQVIGRWAGDRIALVGDYAEPDDLPDDDASVIFDQCSDAMYEPDKDGNVYTDISDLVCAVIEHELEGKYVGTGWRDFKYKRELEGENG